MRFEARPTRATGAPGLASKAVPVPVRRVAMPLGVLCVVVSGCTSTSPSSPTASSPFAARSLSATPSAASSRAQSGVALPEPWLPVSRSTDGLDLTIEVPACPPVASIKVVQEEGNYVVTVLPKASTCTPSTDVAHQTVRLPGPFLVCTGPSVIDGATGQWPQAFAPDATITDILSLNSACAKG